MSLKDEIAELRAIVAGLRDAKPAVATSSPEMKPVPPKDADGSFHAILGAVNDTIGELDGEIERFPHLAALAAFGFGVCFGLVLGAGQRRRR